MNLPWKVIRFISKTDVRHIWQSHFQLQTPFRRLFATSYILFDKAKKENDNVIDLAEFPPDKIRNFSIIAHIDHGKSTLADRILEHTGAIQKTDQNDKVLDTLQVEKERGITVKAQSASIVFRHNNEDYLLNLIDTPGHVDFSHEVARSLSACQGVILLVDANQGVQAQTVANFFLAFGSDLSIIPVLNKVDLKNAQPEIVKEQLQDVFDIDPTEVLQVSAKFGTGVEELLGAVVERIPSPARICKANGSPRALLFDSWFDKYKGVNCQVLVVDGCLGKGDIIQSFFTKKCYEIKELYYPSPSAAHVEKIYAGQVGVITANIREPSETRIGDTFSIKGIETEPLTTIKEPKSMVFAGVYPIESRDQPLLKRAIERLVLNDSSVSVEPESSNALGQGWRLGFLGLLHMDVFNTRLEQEHEIPVIVTTPSVPYKVKITKPLNVNKSKSKKNKSKAEEPEEEFVVNNPAHWPEDVPHVVTYEPIVRATIIIPEHCIGDVSRLCEEYRGVQLNLQQLGRGRVILTYKLPLNEIIVNFYDDLKSLTSGFATFDYEDDGYELSTLVKLGIRLNGVPVEELSCITNSIKSQSKARQMCRKLSETLPRQMFQIAIQAVIGSKIVARENLKALRKDVLAKCYGGDVSRKMKLLKRQAEGKKRMKMIGKIEIPRETFLEILKK